MNDQQTTKQRYQTKILGVRNYESDKMTFDVADFTDLTILQQFLEEVYNGESDLTPAGQAFLDEYFGYDNLAAQLVERGSHLAGSDEISDAEKVRALSSWLTIIDPMEAASFIAEQRGEIAGDESLQEALLPPEE